jgi:ribokinase
VVVGHLGFAKDATPRGSAVSLGGSAYACARGAAIINAQGIGIMARVGDDFDAHALNALGVDLQGVTVLKGPSPRFSIRQYPDGHRSFKSDLGVALDSGIESFPSSYVAASHFHLATMPPIQQAEWLEVLRQYDPQASVSVDMFERMAADDPDLCRAVCYKSDLIFLNQAEYQLLFADNPLPDIPMVVKGGDAGAWYLDKDYCHHVPAPKVEAVDTTGAGEILAGVFLSLRTLGFDVPNSLKSAVTVASAKVSEFGVNGFSMDEALAAVRSSIEEHLKESARENFCNFYNI